MNLRPLVALLVTTLCGCASLHPAGDAAPSASIRSLTITADGDFDVEVAIANPRHRRAHFRTLDASLELASYPAGVIHAELALDVPGRSAGTVRTRVVPPEASAAPLLAALGARDAPPEPEEANEPSEEPVDVDFDPAPPTEEEIAAAKLHPQSIGVRYRIAGTLVDANARNTFAHESSLTPVADAPSAFRE